MSEQTANQPPTAAVEMTAEQAQEHLRQVAAGQATTPTPQEQPPAPEPEVPAGEGFQVINPPVPVYHPRKENETVRGYVLGRFTDGPTDAPFYLIQEPDGGDVWAVYEAPTLKPLAQLVPTWVTDSADGYARAAVGYEVIIDPFRKAGAGFDFIVQARRLVAQTGSTGAIPRPPAYPIPETPPPYPLDSPPRRLKQRKQRNEKPKGSNSTKE